MFDRENDKTAQIKCTLTCFLPLEFIPRDALGRVNAIIVSHFCYLGHSVFPWAPLSTQHAGHAHLISQRHSPVLTAALQQQSALCVPAPAPHPPVANPVCPWPQSVWASLIFWPACFSSCPLGSSSIDQPFLLLTVSVKVNTNSWKLLCAAFGFNHTHYTEIVWN